MIDFRVLVGAVLVLAAVDLAVVFRRPLPIPVLLLHAVAEEREPADVWTLHPGEFERLALRIAGLGFTTLEPAAILAALEGRLPPDRARDACVLTIDDGHVSALDRVGPLLTRHGLKGLFFINPGRGPPGFLDATGIRELARDHPVGSHGRSHQALVPRPGEDPGAFRRRLDDEISGSRTDLETLLGEPVTTFAYPMGEFNARTRDAVAIAGYRLAFTTDLGYLEPGTPPFEIPRFQLNRGVPLEVVEAYLRTPSRERRNRIALELLLIAVLAGYLTLRARSGTAGTARTAGAPPSR